jgi:hypothetical protein
MRARPFSVKSKFSPPVQSLAHMAHWRMTGSEPMFFGEL